MTDGGKVDPFIQQTFSLGSGGKRTVVKKKDESVDLDEGLFGGSTSSVTEDDLFTDIDFSSTKTTNVNTKRSGLDDILIDDDDDDDTTDALLLKSTKSSDMFSAEPKRTQIILNAPTPKEELNLLTEPTIDLDSLASKNTSNAQKQTSIKIGTEHNEIKTTAPQSLDDDLFSLLDNTSSNSGSGGSDFSSISAYISQNSQAESKGLFDD
eukprot:TRINITY_DN6743_c0_g1_i1.p1 TRINITY_DN6743_c0_g1~~TRINITY_DN6743_c0_g1_i1.p1  ORF type:complete len:209 (+),score=57.31 TRINITY_DN6743_c0_g1_i1:56-682(+)